MRPLLAIVGLVVCVLIVMYALDMGPTTPVVAALGTFVGMVAWSALSLADSTPVRQPPPRPVAAQRAVGADRRVKALRSSILFGRNMDGYSERIHESLVDVLDEQLMYAHSIDRQTQPDQAAAILGPELWDFLNDPDAVAIVAKTKELNRIVTLIERV